MPTEYEKQPNDMNQEPNGGGESPLNPETMDTIARALKGMNAAERERLLETAMHEDVSDTASVLSDILPGATQRRVFRRKPIKEEPYVIYDLFLGEAGKKDEDQLKKRVARGLVEVSEIARAANYGQSFPFVQMQMKNLPTVVYLGGKEEDLVDPDPEVDAAIQFMKPWGIAQGLLGTSGVAGGGSSLMALGQSMHLYGIKTAKRFPGNKPLWKKAGVCGVTLAIQQEAPNAHTTSGWVTIPAMNLSIRKGRLFRLGLPVAAIYFKGGDATLDEFFFVKAQAKDNLSKQINTPFGFIRPRLICIDSVNRSFWGDLLKVYVEKMTLPRVGRTGKERETERLRRKADEIKHLMEGLIYIDEKDPKSALAGAKKAMELLMPNYSTFYGRSPVEEWESRMDLDFWDTVWDLQQKVDEDALIKTV